MKRSKFKRWLINTTRDYFKPCKDWRFWVVVIGTAIILHHYNIRLSDYMPSF